MDRYMPTQMPKPETSFVESNVQPHSPRKGATPHSNSSESSLSKNIYLKEEYFLENNPLPEDWEAPKASGLLGHIHLFLFSSLSLMAFGHSDLKHMWAATRLALEDDDELWTRGSDEMCDRMGNLLLVAGLLLATTAVFLTTTPPLTKIVDYTLRGPYICMLASFGLLVGGIIVAAICYLIIAKADPRWVKEVMLPDCFHIYSTLIMLSYPFISIGAATVFLAFGMLAGVWAAEDLGIKLAAPLPLFLPVGIGVLFCISCATAGAPSVGPGRRAVNGAV